MNIGLFFFQNPLVVNTINAVLAISHALGTVRRELCPGKLHCFHIYIYIYIYIYMYLYWMASVLQMFNNIKRTESCACFKKEAYVLYSICLYVAAGVAQYVQQLPTRWMVQLGARFSLPVKTSFEAHLASCPMGTMSLFWE